MNYFGPENTDGYAMIQGDVDVGGFACLCLLYF